MDGANRTGQHNMKPKTRKRLKVLCVWLLCLAAGIVLFFIIVPPPVEGFYFSRLFEILDSSTTYAYLADGEVYTVSSHGRGQVRWELVGTYEAVDGKVLVTPVAVRGEPFGFTPGWFRLKWERDAYDRLLGGEPVGWDDNWRIWMSAAKFTMLCDDGRPGREQNLDQAEPDN